MRLPVSRKRGRKPRKIKTEICECIIVYIIQEKEVSYGTIRKYISKKQQQARIIRQYGENMRK